MTEQWRDIPNFEGYYQVSNLGNFRSMDRIVPRSNGQMIRLKGKPLKPNYDRDGYVIYGLKKHNQRTAIKAHRVVMEVFVGQSSLTVDHKNSDKKDNRLENLSYMTIGDNTRKAFVIGEHKGKLSVDKVKEIRRDIAKGLKPSIIMKKHGIKRSNFGYIKNNIIWKDVY